MSSYNTIERRERLAQFVRERRNGSVDWRRLAYAARDAGLFVQDCRPCRIELSLFLAWLRRDKTRDVRKESPEEQLDRLLNDRVILWFPSVKQKSLPGKEVIADD